MTLTTDPMNDPDERYRRMTPMNRTFIGIIHGEEIADCLGMSFSWVIQIFWYKIEKSVSGLSDVKKKKNAISMGIASGVGSSRYCCH